MGIRSAANVSFMPFSLQCSTALQDRPSCATVPQPNLQPARASPVTPIPTTCLTAYPTTQNPKTHCNILQQLNQNLGQQYQHQQQHQFQQQQHQYAPKQQYTQPQQQFPDQQQKQQQLPYDLDDSELRGKELRKLVQHLYVAQARVQLEATEIHKAQAVARSAQSQLEDSANHVRTITATLHNAQQEVAAAAIRAQIAQLQLAAHDQLLFAARQDVDALSSQVVGLQAAEGIVQPKLTVDLHALLDKLRQPLQSFDRPTPVPMIITLPPFNEAPLAPARQRFHTDLGMGLGTGTSAGIGSDIRGDGKSQDLMMMKVAQRIPYA